MRRAQGYSALVAQTTTTITAVLTANITVLKAAIRTGVMDGASNRIKNSPDSTIAAKVLMPMNSSLPIRCQFIYSEDRGEDLPYTVFPLPKQTGLLLL